MKKNLALWLLAAAIFTTGANAYTVKSNVALPVTISVSKLQANKPVRGKMMFTVTYKNISSKPRDLFIFALARYKLKHVNLTVKEFPKVKPTGTFGYQLEVYKLKPGVRRVIHIYMPMLDRSELCYGAKLYVKLDNGEWAESKLLPVGC